jgi:type I restriction enzyme S subunit
MPKLTQGNMLRVPIVAPPLRDQRAIAGLLGALDDKIELNRQMNETLEAMARALFKSWFIDFDPVHAKTAGRAPFGMDAATADLFPSTFTDGIPTGWQLRPLGEVVSYLKRGIGPTYVDARGVRVVNQKCIRGGRVDFTKSRRHDESRRSVQDRLLLVGDVLVNSTGVGTLGRVAQVRRLAEPTIADSHVTVVRARVDTLRSELLGIGLEMRESEIEALGEGSTGQTELSRERLSLMTTIVPSMAVQAAFATIVIPASRAN